MGPTFLERADSWMNTADTLIQQGAVCCFSRLICLTLSLFLSLSLNLFQLYAQMIIIET